MASAACGSFSPLAGARSRPSRRSARWPTAVREPREKEPGRSGIRRAATVRRSARLAGRHPLLLFDHALAIDAVAGEGQRLEALVTDGLAAALAVAERAVVDLLQRRYDVAENAAVGVAALRKKIARIRG